LPSGPNPSNRGSTYWIRDRTTQRWRMIWRAGLRHSYRAFSARGDEF
jgi:hypothetical protein